jgi:hypothetical protein
MLNVLRQEHILQNMFVYEEADTSCCEAQDMSLMDDAMSDMKQPNILVPQVIVSGAMFMFFVLIVCNSMMKFAD